MEYFRIFRINKIDDSTIENLNKEIELIEILKKYLITTRRYEEICFVRNREKEILKKLEAINENF